MAKIGTMIALAKALGTPNDTQVNSAVSAWLAAHPEATTTVEDGAITNAKLASSFVTPGTAAAYSSSATYAVGDYVFYGGTLYRCITAITTAEAWTAAHWTAAVLGDDVGDLKSAIGAVSNGSTVSYWGDYPVQQYASSGTGATAVALNRNRSQLLLNGTAPTNNLYIKVNDATVRTTSQTTVNNWAGISLQTGHLYFARVLLTSGAVSKSLDGNMQCSISVYKEGTHTSVGDYWFTPNGDGFIRSFTAEAGSKYVIAFYATKNSVYTNAQFTVDLVDMSLGSLYQQQMEPIIKKVVTKGTYNSYGEKPCLESVSCNVKSSVIPIVYDGFTSANSQGMAYFGGYVFIAQKAIKNGTSSQNPYLHILSFDGSALTYVRSIALPVGDLSPADIEFHCNCLSFADAPQTGNTYPLLYVTMMWNSSTYDGRNECFVYQLANDLTAATLVQQIYYQRDTTEEIDAYSSNFIIDERGYLWMFGNTATMTSAGSYGRFLKQLAIPDTANAVSVISKADVIREYMLNDALYQGIGLATYQGGTIKNGLLVAPTSGTGAALVIIDVDTGRLVNYTPLASISTKEFEDAFVLNGIAYYNTADNYFFVQEFLN